MLTEGSQDYFEEQKTSEEVATTLKATLELYSKE